MLQPSLIYKTILYNKYTSMYIRPCCILFVIQGIKKMIHKGIANPIASPLYYN